MGSIRQAEARGLSRATRHPALPAGRRPLSIQGRKEPMRS
jgi:hypothetical protein